MSKPINHILFTIACVIGMIGTANAQTSSYGQLQAAYLFNFAKYIRWPDDVKVFTIGIYGDSEIMEILEVTLRDKKAGGKPIEVKQIKSISVLAEFHIVYLPGSASKSLGELKKAVEGKSVLIVTEDDLIKKGATISFVVEEDRLRFKLKKSALLDAGLVASEGLLKLAILL